MGLTPTFSQADIKKRMDKFLEVVQRKQIERLQYLGEMCVTHAREIPAEVGFGDVTGNLRSSIGYVLFKNGIAIHEFYEVNGEGAEGAKAGKDLATKIGSKHKNGISLVVTAGMNYAVYVESRGKDVLTSAETLAIQELPKMLNKFKANINSALK